MKKLLMKIISWKNREYYANNILTVKQDAFYGSEFRRNKSK